MKIAVVSIGSFDTQYSDYHIMRDIILGFLKRGHEVSLIQKQYLDTPRYPQQFDKYLGKQLQVHNIKFEKKAKADLKARYLADLSYYRQACKWMKENKPDRVFLQSCNTAFFTVFYAKHILKCPLLYNEQDIFPENAYFAGILSESSMVYKVAHALQKYDMRHELQAKHPENAKKVKFYIGDVRNPQSIRDAMPGVDYIFHAAALKQVPSCEFFPMQAVQTNIIGTDNVLHAAIDAGVKRVVCLSTDKAAYPINAMGISKAMMEHVIYANARVAAERGGTTICCTRYGNVMCSRGSVIPLFIDQIKAGNPITITDPNMTRFLMNLDEAVDLVLFAFQHANPGDLFIQKSDASTIGDLAKAVQQLFGDTGTNIIGTRHGEKLFETLMTREERLRSQDMGHYFRVAADNRDLNYDKFVVKGEVHTMADESYTSHNTIRLDVEGTVKKILTTEYVQNELKGIPNV